MSKFHNSGLDLTRDLNAKVDLVSLVENQGVVLKKRGNLFEGRCPFHDDDTPSFKVFPQTQHYHCFGCGEHGFALHFLKKHKNMSGVEAIQYLAELTHTALEESTVANLRYAIAQDEKTREILKIATDFYAGNFRNSGQAIEYLLETRQFEWDICLEHKIGLSASNLSIVEFFREKHSSYTSDDLIAAGVANLRKNGAVGDYFIGNRIIFPIYDSTKRVVMLSGRVIDDSKPKYLHTRHQKNEVLYGIHALPKGFDKLIVVEGNFDALRGIERGLPVVATMGGKASDWQVQRLLELSSYGDKPIYLCADTDDAGIKAMFDTIKLSFKHLHHTGGLIKVVELPSDSDEKVDLDSFLLSRGIEEFNGVLDGELPASEFFKQAFLKKHTIENFDSQLPEMKATLAAKLSDELKEVPNGEFKSNLINFCLDKSQNQDVVLSQVVNSLAHESDKVDVVFWRESVKNKKPVLSVVIRELHNHLLQSGFCRYWEKDSDGQNIRSMFVRVKNQVVSIESAEKIRDYVLRYVKGIKEQLTENFTKNDLEELLLQKANAYFTEFHLGALDAVDLVFHKDTEKSTFFYYQNCFVEVTADGISTHDYSKLQGVIWERQILKRNFKMLSAVETQKGIFSQFQRNICRPRNIEFDDQGEHGKRLKSLQCAIGYSLHRFRTSTRIAMVIFNDERITDEPKGRSGKGLTCKGISYMRSMVIIDGKQFDPDYQHNFQNVRRDTNIMLFDDLAKKFDLERQFALMSNGMTINIKGQSIPVTIPFEESPKNISTTNYVVGGDSDSHTGRRWEVVMSTYYDVDFTPEVEFGLRLFEGFDSTEWSRFDNYMMLCARKYLQIGMYKHTSENLAIRKLIQATSADFIDFANDLERDVEHDKAETLKQFKEAYPDYERILQRTFTSWLHKYALHTQGIKLDERKSNGKNLFSFVKLGELHKN